jgi:microcystin-dependent protein
MAAHNHTAVAMASANGPNATQPSGKYLGKGGRSTPLENIYTTASTPAATMGVTGTMISPTGGNQPHNNMQPFLAMNYIICMQGLFPVRN